MNRLFFVLILLLSLPSKGFSQLPSWLYLPGDNCLYYSSWDTNQNLIKEYVYLKNDDMEQVEGKEYYKVCYENKSKTGQFSVILHMRQEGEKILVRYDEYKSLQAVLGRDMTDFDKLCRYEVTADGDMILYDFGMQVGDKFRHVEGLEDIYVVDRRKCTWNYNSICNHEITAIFLSNHVSLLEGLGYERFNIVGSAPKTPDFFDYLNEHPNKKTQLTFAIVGEERIYDLIFDGGGSSVGSITFDKSQMPFDIFDLQGRRVKGQPTQKGLYIQNGKKVIVK